jgi:hypothetical protein
MRGCLYFLARLLGNVSAIRRGPKAVVTRKIRRHIIRHVSRIWRIK